MATHTESGGGNFGRKFQIMRENGTENKEGVPYFAEWVRELPADPGKRKFETRRAKDGTPRYYELFKALDGHLLAIDIESKDFGKGSEQWLVLKMQDGPEDYVIELGQVDGRYSMHFMKCILSPVFDPNLKLRLSPFSIKNDNGSFNIGLSMISGADGKLSGKWESEWLEGMPQPSKVVFKGQDNYDYTPVANWLVEQVGHKVLPKLKKDPISAPSNARDFDIKAEFPTVDLSSAGDEIEPDLPF